MKKISIVCLSGLLFFTACENTSSSTVGVYENPEEASSSETKEEPTMEHEPEKQEMAEPPKPDTAKPDTMKTLMKDTSKTSEK